MNFNHGFTYIEVLLVLGLAAVVFTISTKLVMTQLIPKASVNSAAQILSTDMRHQQLQAMQGSNVSGSENRDSQGIYFESNRYTLFSGSTFNPNDSTNRVVTLDNSVTVTTTLDNSTLLFKSGSGEIQGFIPSQNTITLSLSPTNEQRVLVLNALGIIEAINQ